MVVDRPGLLRVGVRYRDAQHLRVGCEFGDEVEAQLTGEECLVVARRHRVVSGHARDRLDQAVARQDDVVGVVEVRQQGCDLLAVVDVEVVEGAALVLIDIADAGQGDRHPIVPVLAIDRCAGRNIFVDPDGGLQPRHRLRVDMEVGQAPQDRQQRHGDHGRPRSEGEGASPRLKLPGGCRGQLGPRRPGP